MSANKKKTGLSAQVKTFPHAFWMPNTMEMLQRLAYYGVRVVIPIHPMNYGISLPV